MRRQQQPLLQLERGQFEANRLQTQTAGHIGSQWDEEQQQQQQQQAAKQRLFRARSCSACRSTSSSSNSTRDPQVFVHSVGTPEAPGLASETHTSTPSSSCCSTLLSSSSRPPAAAAAKGSRKHLSALQWETGDPEGLKQVLQELWQMLRKHEFASAQAVCEAEETAAANAEAIRQAEARLREGAERLKSRSAQEVLLQHSIAAATRNVLDYESDIKSAIQRLTEIEHGLLDDSSGTGQSGVEDQQEDLEDPTSQDALDEASELLRVSEHVKSARHAVEEAAKEVETLRQQLLLQQREQQRRKLCQRMRVVQQKYQLIGHRQGRLQQLQHWWEAYGQRQLQHVQRQAELLHQRQSARRRSSGSVAPVVAAPAVAAPASASAAAADAALLGLSLPLQQQQLFSQAAAQTCKELAPRV